jgi:hypothetical protein
MVFFYESRILKNSRIKSPPFSREDLGGLFASCENEFANEHNLQICKWLRNVLSWLLHHASPNLRNPIIRLIRDSDNLMNVRIPFPNLKLLYP